jgi:hypothetical protein
MLKVGDKVKLKVNKEVMHSFGHLNNLIFRIRIIIELGEDKGYYLDDGTHGHRNV